MLPPYIEVEREVARLNESLGVDDPLMPDESLLLRVSPAATLGPFRELALNSFRVLRHMTHLSPESHVFDMGCGLGRVAIPLTRYLTSGTYTGVDVMADLVEEARGRISSAHPNFQFHHLDVYSGSYNKAASSQARDVRFHFPDSGFDVIFLFSVFSHMLPEDVATYLAEFQRLLRPGGMVLATFFLMTPRAEAVIARGRTEYTFPHPHGEVRVQNPEIPEAAVCYPQPLAEALIRDSGLEQVYTSYGSWSAHPRALTGQDVIVCRKGG